MTGRNEMGNRQLRNNTNWNSRRLSLLLSVVAAFFLLTGNGMSADPGVQYPPDGMASDQKPGSVLFFNVYTSDATSASSQNTKFSITNTSPTRAVAVHLFFVDGASGSPADFIFCLTASQTISFESVELDPNTEGYIVAVAVNSAGAPILHNHLIGDSYVKFNSGHRAGLGAVAVAAMVPPVTTSATVMADLNFNGIDYEQMPSVLAVDNLPSRINNNDTMVIVNRPGGDMAVGVPEIGFIFGLLYNDTENAYSFSVNSSRCQTRINFTSTTPRTVPRFTAVVPDGRTGWVKMYGATNIPLLGSVFNYNSGASGVPNAFTGGHNLHSLRRTDMTMSIPVYPTKCFGV